LDRPAELNETRARTRPSVDGDLRRGAVVGVGVALVLICWAATIGRYGGPDEPAHVLRAHAVAHGDLLGDPADGLPPGYRTVTVPSSLGTGDPACYRHDPTVTSGCAAGEQGGVVSVATSAGTNPPLYYALVGLPVRLFGAADDPLAYRLAAVALVAIALGLVAARLRTTPTRRALALAAVAPSAWFLWGVVNPNALEIALVALAATGVVGRPAPKETSGPHDDAVDAASDAATSDCWWVSIPLAIAIAMRPIAAVWAVTVIVLAVLAARRDRRLATVRQRAVLVVPPVLMVAAVAAWNAWSGLVVDDERTAGTGSTFHAVASSAGGLPRTAAELVASMGWLEYWAPWPAVVAWGVAVGSIAAAGRPRVPTSNWLVLAAALVLVPVAFEVAWYERVGLIWQGRYSLPVAAIAVVVACASPTTAAHPSRTRWLPMVAVVAAAAGVQLTFWNAARRYAVGTDGSWWFRDADDSSRWLGPGTWVAVHGVLVSVAAVVAVRALRAWQVSRVAARPVVSSSAPAGSNATDRATPTADPLR
jgi:Predicted membrane protein (DUF2142)